MVNVTTSSVELNALRPESIYTISSVRAYTAAGPGEERRLTATTNTCYFPTQNHMLYCIRSISIGLQLTFNKYVLVV